MFRLFRFFLLTSAAAAVAIALAYYHHRQSEVAHLITQAEKQNLALARSFANTIWPQLSEHLTSDFRTEAQIERSRQALEGIVATVSAGLPVLKIKIYDLQGLTIYSSNPDEIGEYKHNNPGFFAAARNGDPASKLTYRNQLSSFERTVQKRDVVESYLPVRQGSGPVQAVFELYTDVTLLMADIERATFDLVTHFAPILLALYGVLLLVVRYADRTIRHQYADLAEKNTALENEVGERARVEAALTRARNQLEQRVEERTRALAMEINERKRAEDEAKRHRNELAHSGRVSMIGEMATSLAHELNQPLTVISGCAQFCIGQLRNPNGKSERLLDAIEQTAEQANRASAVIRRVRGFIHKDDPERKLIDINEVVRDLMDLLSIDAREHGCDIRFEPTEPMSLVMADPIQIQQVILNLARNGIEAMEGCGATPKCLSIRTFCRSNGMAQVSVRDQGNGLSSDSVDNIFEPFFTTKPQGLGMGLSISRTIVEAHGGRLWATSGDSNGTVFHFTLPPANVSSHASI